LFINKQKNLRGFWVSDLICIGFDEEGKKRVKTACDFLLIDQEFYKGSDVLFETEGLAQPRCVLISAVNIEKKEDIVNKVQVIRQVFPETFIVLIAEKKIKPEDAKFVKKSGCNYVILEPDFLYTTRLEYILLQVVCAAYVPVKVSDFKPNTTVDFSVYTIMTLNKKILPVIQAGTVLSDARLAKLSTVSELYVKRNQVDMYTDYVTKNKDLSAKGLANRCRAEFQSVALAHANLVFLLTDQAEAGSFDQGKILLENCQNLAKNLLETLTMLPDPWEVLSQSTFGMIGGTERSIMIAAMAAVASFNTMLGSPEETMLAGLFCDLALLELSPKSLGKLDSAEGRLQLKDEDIAVFKNHPVTSLNRMLENKMQISDSVKNIIVCTHEQADKKGFPKHIMPDKIPPESALILFHEMVDLEFRMKLGAERESYPVVRKRVFDREDAMIRAKTARFSGVVIEKLRKMIAEQSAGQ